MLYALSFFLAKNTFNISNVYFWRRQKLQGFGWTLLLGTDSECTVAILGIKCTHTKGMN